MKGDTELNPAWFNLPGKPALRAWIEPARRSWQVTELCVIYKSQYTGGIDAATRTMIDQLTTICNRHGYKIGRRKFIPSWELGPGEVVRLHTPVDPLAMDRSAGGLGEAVAALLS